jgi:hypothetical protein
VIINIFTCNFKFDILFFYSAELKRYSEIVASLFEGAQHLLQLKLELEREVDGGITSSRSRRKRNSEKSVFLKSTSVEEILQVLNEITSFFAIVAIPLVIQDFSYLLQRYLRKTKKSLVNPMVSHNR